MIAVSKKLKSFPYFSLLGGIFTAFVLVCATLLVINTSNLAVRNCRQVELVKAEIRSVISAGLVQLGTKGSPGYEYYHSHPAELVRAIVTTRDELATFAPHSC